MGSPAMAAAQGGLVAAGTTLQIYGQKKARKEEIRALEKEAIFLDEQAGIAQKMGDRRIKAIEREATELYGDQVNAFSKNGVDLSGSALSQLAMSQVIMDEEAEAVAEDTAFNVRLAKLRAGSMRESVASIKNAGFLQDLTTAIGGAAQIGSIANQNISRTKAPTKGSGAKPQTVLGGAGPKRMAPMERYDY
jgi:hypothetical protein